MGRDSNLGMAAFAAEWCTAGGAGTIPQQASTPRLRGSGHSTMLMYDVLILKMPDAEISK